MMLTTEQLSRFILKSYFTFLNRTYDVRGYTSLPKGPKIIAMNHTQGCDPFYLPFVLEDTPHFLIQDGLFRLPVIGALLKETGQIPVRRGTEKANAAKEQACALLRQGKTIVIFPEGKEVPWGQRIPAKSGTVRMSLETGAPIIPLGLYTSPQSLTPVQFKWRGNPCSGVWQFSGTSYMRFGDAWTPSPRSDVYAETEELMNRIYSLVAEAEREYQCISFASLDPSLS
jgi:1-acyl-sn-glycerol-3-phosphate acyltransferase